MLTKREAEDLLSWAYTQNPGSWVDHSKTVARAAETIAAKCGMDDNTAYTLGLLHDIGRYEAAAELRHIYAGYHLMNEKGHHHNARICLTHSFPYKNIKSFSGKNDCASGEIQQIQAKLKEYEYDDYDKLIQLCDSICMAKGVCLMEVRMVEIARRYNTINQYILHKWNELFEIKKYFDNKCGINIYQLFALNNYAP